MASIPGLTRIFPEDHNKISTEGSKEENLNKVNVGSKVMKLFYAESVLGGKKLGDLTRMVLAPKGGRAGRFAYCLLDFPGDIDYNNPILSLEQQYISQDRRPLIV
jgi:hypothetical protein